MKLRKHSRPLLVFLGFTMETLVSGAILCESYEQHIYPGQRRNKNIYEEIREFMFLLACNSQQTDFSLTIL